MCAHLYVWDRPAFLDWCGCWKGHRTVGKAAGVDQDSSYRIPVYCEKYSLSIGEAAQEAALGKQRATVALAVLIYSEICIEFLLCATHCARC